MFAFASCDNKSDCECKATIDGEAVGVVGTVTEFDNDCDQVKLGDLTLSDKWQGIEQLGTIVLSCEEK